MVTVALGFFGVGSLLHGFGDLPSWEKVRPAIQASIGTYKPISVTDAAVKAACNKLHENDPTRVADCKNKLGEINSSTRIWSNTASLRKWIEDKQYFPSPGYTVEVERALLEQVTHVATPRLGTVFGTLWLKLLEGLWQWLTAFVAAAILFANGVSTFGFNLRRGAFGFLGAAANSVDPTGRHERLRSDFENVSDLIGRNLVIFIDDLDRCQPEKVVETLEAINFLVTAGKCAVVMGMDYQRVQDSVDLVRKDLAEAESAVATPKNSKPEYSYAHGYLQKLVNVEMPIAAARDRVKALVTRPGPPVEEQRTLAQYRGWLTYFQRPRVWRLSVWVILLGLAVSVYSAVPYMHEALVPQQPFEEVTTMSDDGEQPSVGDTQPQPSTPGIQADPPIDVTPKPATDASPAPVFWPAIVGIVLVLIVEIGRAHV